MAAKGEVDRQLNTLAPDVKRPLIETFHYVMSNGTLGSQAKAENFLWYRITSTTASVANTEFSVAHGMDHAPTTLIPVLDLTAVDAQLVPLTVSRAPDMKRVYLKSSSTSAVFTAYLE